METIDFTPYIESIYRELKLIDHENKHASHLELYSHNKIVKTEYYDIVYLKIKKNMKNCYISPFSSIIIKDKLDSPKSLLAIYLGKSKNIVEIALQNANHLIKNFSEPILILEGDLTFLLYIQIDILDKISENKISRIVKLKNLITGNLLFNPSSTKILEYGKMNASQLESVNKIINMNENNWITLIHGPPGTGKTSVISESIIQLINDENFIIITSHTNVAVDNALEKIHSIMSHRNMNADELLVRLGNPVVSDSDIIQKLYVKSIPQYNELKGKILGLTLSKLSILINDKDFNYDNPPADYLFLDEASMANLPLTLMSMIFASKIVLLGDPHQLPPIIRDKEAKNEVKISLFEKLIKLYPSISSFLNIQYRSHPSISKFSSVMFYNDKLISHESTESNQISLDDPNPPILFDGANHFVWLDSKNGGEMLWKKLGRASSAYNLYEVALVGCILNYYRDNNFDIGRDIRIITPFRLQAHIIEQMIKDELQLEMSVDDLDRFPSSSTIDRIQGREVSILLISLVDSGLKWNVHRILNDYRRLNVAITRAKNKIIIIGSSNLGTHQTAPKFIKSLYNYAKNQNIFVNHFKDCDISTLLSVAEISLDRITQF